MNIGQLFDLLDVQMTIFGDIYTLFSRSCVQDPWVQNGTIRDNILMCDAFDEATYDAVVRACALDEDLAAMPLGDATEIGEKGVALSGMWPLSAPLLVSIS